MGLFKNMFGSGNEPVKRENEFAVNWNALTDVYQISKIIEASKTKPQLIFKHSTRCGISRMVLKNFELDFKFDAATFDLHYIDLLNYREISTQIATTFEVMHQSPQLLILKNGVVVMHDSHSAINEIDLNQYV